MSIRRALVIPDCHRKDHARRAYNLMLEVALYAGRIDEVVLLGDYADFYHVSRHDKDPRVSHHLIDEIESVNEGLDEIDRLFPKARKIYLEGNHEIRLENYLIQRAPALFGLTECRELFQIRKRGWIYQGFGRNQGHRVLGADLIARHRPLANNPQSSLSKAMCSHVFGDCHRIVQAHAVGLDGNHYVAFSPGWLGDPRSRVFDYMPSVPQWQHGFAIVSVEGASKSFHHEIIEIKNNKTIFHGKEFKA